MYDAYRAVLFDLFGTLVDDRAEAIPGAREVLVSMPEGRWAIVTSCGERLARALLANAGLPVPQTLVSDDDVENSKPAPDCYQLAAHRLEVPAQTCLVVEDSLQGVQAGLAAGMDVVAVRRGRAMQFPARANVVDAIGALHFTVDDGGLLRVEERRCS